MITSRSSSFKYSVHNCPEVISLETEPTAEYGASSRSQKSKVTAVTPIEKKNNMNEHAICFEAHVISNPEGYLSHFDSEMFTILCTSLDVDVSLDIFLQRKEKA